MEIKNGTLLQKIFKQSNIFEERENRAEETFEEIMAQNFQNERQQITNQVRINMKKCTSMYIEVKQLKTRDKEEILKTERKGNIIYRGTQIKIQKILRQKLCKPENNGMTSFKEPKKAGHSGSYL